MFCLSWVDNNRWGMVVYLCVSLYWLVNFLHAVSHFGTAYSVVAWYFGATDGHVTCCDCRRSIKGLLTGFVVHPGSLAFGALLVTIAQIGRILLCWLRHKGERRNPAQACLIKCLSCIADCLLRCVKQVSEHAYVEIAVHGQAFCKSVDMAARLAIRKPALFALVGRVCCMVRFLGVIFITVGTMVFVNVLMIFWRTPGLSSQYVPPVTAGIIAFVIGEVMLHPFSAASRAMAHCLCLEEDPAPAMAERFNDLLMRSESLSPSESRSCCCGS